MENNSLQKTLLEEYKTLREELLLHVKVINNILVSSGTLVFITLTFMVKIDVDYDICGIVLLLLLLPLFFKYRDEVFTIIRIATYIEEKIEKKVEGLNWTKMYNNACSKQSSLFKIEEHISRISIRAEVLYFMVLLIIAWLLPLLFGKCFYSVGSTVLMIMLSMIYIYNYVLLRNYRKYRLMWEKKWLNLPSKEEKQIN